MDEELRTERRIRKIIQGVRKLFGGDEVATKPAGVLVPTEAVVPTKKEKKVIEKEEIMKILPHRGRMLFLDEVEITIHKVIGRFQVTREVCEDHSFKVGNEERLVFRGADILDMAAQLLGVWAAQYPDFFGQLAFVRKYGETKFQGTVSPGENLEVEIVSNDLIADITIRPRFRKIIITGKDFSAKVNGQQKARISFVELVGVDSPRV